jgi:hypothetical protein
MRLTLVRTQCTIRKTPTKGIDMGRPTLGGTETVRFQMKLTSEELDAIETWRYANRIPSNSEAIRRLCKIALATSKEQS